MDLSFRMLVCATLVATCLVEGVRGTCGELMPGMNQMMRSVDVTSLDLIPQDISTDNGYKRKFIKITCYNNKKKNIAGTMYSVPDQVSHQSAINSGSLSSNRHVMRTSKEMRKSLSVNAGVEGTFKKFAFSASTTYTKTQRKLTKNEKTVQTLSAQFNSKRVDLQSAYSLQIDDEAKRRIDQLPSTFSAGTRSEYEAFIADYGTHYIATARFGGLLSMYLETNSAYSESEESTKLEVNAEATFMQVLKIKGGTTTTSSQIDTSFASNTESRMNYFGGVANLVKEGGIAEWQPTIEKKPWIYAADVKPISDLLTDPTRKQAMNQALEDYVMRTYLRYELPRMLSIVPSYYQRTKAFTVEQRHIAEMLEKPVLRAWEVEELQNRDEYLFAYMMWHSSTVQPTVAPHLNDKMMCPPGMIVSFLSRAGGVFSGKCVYPKGFGRLSCTKSHTVYRHGPESWDDWFRGEPVVDLSYTCPYNSALKGIEGQDDSFHFTCCEATGMWVDNTPRDSHRYFDARGNIKDTGHSDPQNKVFCQLLRYNGLRMRDTYKANYCSYLKVQWVEG